MKTQRMKCLLGYKLGEESRGCSVNKCKTCGWEKAEAKRRRQYIRAHGLTLCSDGLRRCLLKKVREGDNK